MEPLPKTPSLVELGLSYISLNQREKYMFSIETLNENNYFSAEYFHSERIVSFRSEKVPDTVWGEIAEIARTAGDLGKPDKSPPARTYPPGVQVSTPFRPIWYCGLKWSDGSETGMGTAKDKIMQYLIVLAEKCVETAQQEGPLDEGTAVSIREKWVCPTCGFDENLTNYCGGCGKMRPEETWKNATYFARKEKGVWVCPACGYNDNVYDFCAECGAAKPTGQ